MFWRKEDLTTFLVAPYFIVHKFVRPLNRLNAYKADQLYAQPTKIVLLRSMVVLAMFVSRVDLAEPVQPTQNAEADVPADMFAMPQAQYAYGTRQLAVLPAQIL